ncbi:DUF2950 domain-containing protein [Sulfitobacter sp. SK012]|uniref:DUF2950 family protein n=1 Tax=Sulfitobacter sp. SK012 TaxID=1389005 RepID=UPI000E0C89C1|nr:DUF2950 family protein [Sulfitobacter sp. SK012]AXI44742.1 DUF2950 domain-containing protein [Sulfitobacter sp. SK012]
MRKSILKIAALSFFLAGPLAAEPASYATPQDALDAMMDALKAGNKEAVLTVFGAESEDFISDGDPAEDASNRQELLTLYSEGYRMAPQADGSLVLALGAEGWPFPIPLAKTGDSWAFDIDAGRDEVLHREIGVNELDVIELLEAYVDIQGAFRLTDHDKDGVMEFARQIIASSPDLPDGLFWATPDSPLGELFARASVNGYSDGEQDHEPDPYSGYYFRVLTEQSAEAPGGEMSYLVNDNMVSGHALLAVPAVFGSTGIHSFMVSENGVVLEAILGEETLEIAADMLSYNPTSDWTPVE